MPKRLSVVDATWTTQSPIGFGNRPAPWRFWIFEVQPTHALCGTITHVVCQTMDIFSHIALVFTVTRMSHSFSYKGWVLAKFWVTLRQSLFAFVRPRSKFWSDPTLAPSRTIFLDKVKVVHIRKTAKGSILLKENSTVSLLAPRGQNGCWVTTGCSAINLILSEKLYIYVICLWFILAYFGLTSTLKRLYNLLWTSCEE